MNATTRAKDLIIFGAYAGIIANIPKNIIAWIFHWCGWLRYTFEHIAAGYFVDLPYIDQPLSLITGFIADFTNAGFFGVLLYFILQKTGKDYAVLKGLAFGSFLYLIFYGTFMAMDMTRASLLTPLPNFLLYIPHTVFGGVAGWILSRYSGLPD